MQRIQLLIKAETGPSSIPLLRGATLCAFFASSFSVTVDSLLSLFEVD